MALLRLPCRNQNTERCGYVYRSCFNIPRHLHRTRLEGRNHHRKPGSGTHRPPRYEGPHGSLRSNRILQPALLWRPNLGYSRSRWFGTGRSLNGHKERLPLPPHIGEHGSFTRAKHDSSLLKEIAGSFPQIRCKDFYRHIFNPVRERRCYAPNLG